MAKYYKGPDGTKYTSPEVAKQYGVNIGSASSGVSIEQQQQEADSALKTPNVQLKTYPSAPLATNPPNAPNVPGPQVMGDATSNLAGFQQDYLKTLQGIPSSYDLYQKELKSRGIDTLTKQETEIGQAALEQEKALRPLLSENVSYKFPKSLQQLQDVGVNQEQLNLLAAKERAPIAQGLSDLLRSQSLIGQQIERQMALSKHAVELQQSDNDRKMQIAELTYDFAKELHDGTALDQKEAKAFALENGITQPYYQIGSTVYQTSDGYAFKSEEDFTQKTGQPVESIASQGLIQKVEPTQEAATSDIAEYEYAVATGFQGDFLDYQAERASRTRAPSTRKGPPSPNSDFSDTQIAKGAAAAGMSISEFKELDEDDQNYFINGEGSDLINGEIPPLDDGDFEDVQDEIDSMYEDGYGLGEVRDEIDNLDISQEDKEELKDYAEETAPKGGLFGTGFLKR